ncbi:hypothetical protein L6R29_08625 [Myxococcota bacterium]|nr:hypothetical protein [Myxococcota bacterium]
MSYRYEKGPCSGAGGWGTAPTTGSGAGGWGTAPTTGSGAGGWGTAPTTGSGAGGSRTWLLSTAQILLGLTQLGRFRGGSPQNPP